MKNDIKRLKSRLTSNSGMTLVEVLVAMTILMIIIFTFTPLFAQYFRNVKSSGEMTRQTYEKASLIERLLSNRDSDNNSAYETYNVGVPLELYVKNSSNSTLKTLDFHTDTDANYVSDVEGNLVTTDGDKSNSGNEYTTIYLGSTSQRLVAFPKALTDDFIEKDIIVVPIGFPENLNLDKFHVYYTDEYGNWKNHEVEKGKYYTVTDASDGDVQCAKFTFYGANETICFGNSPLVITYNSHQVEIEITAPKIIMVGEKASDGHYYYYATSGVDPNTGRMDLVAKDSANLVSAMNDVEWVEKGRGDNGETGSASKVNDYGYYIMGGDAGQVRRFWRRGTSAKPGNYYWGGDTLGQYNRYYNITANNRASTDSYETVNQTKSTQAQFKSIFRTAQEGAYSYNGVENANTITSSEITTFFDYKMVTSNYYTANVLGTENYNTTIGRILSLKSGNNEYRYAGCGTELYDQPKGLFTSFIGFRQTANKNLRTSMTPTNQYSKLNVAGYKEATNYDYNGTGNANTVGGDGIFNDTSLITITSVGAIQINKENTNYSESTQTSVLNSPQLYPTNSYTLYCGYIPAVIDTWGWKTKNVGSLLYNNYSMWLHTGTLGIATDGDYWYPVGKFGDTKTDAVTSESTPDTLSEDVFGENTPWSTLLNYGTSSSLYPFGNTQTTITSVNKVPTGKFLGRHTVQINFKYKPIVGGEKNSTETPTQTGTEYDSEREKFCTGFGTTLREIVSFNVDGYVTTFNDRSFTDGKMYNVRIGPGNDDFAIIKYVSDGCRLLFPDEIREAQYTEETTTSTGYFRYYGPSSNGSGYSTQPSDVTNATLTKRSFIGTALPQEGNDYYITAGHEVDITMGYLSQPYAISVLNPATPQVSGLSGISAEAASERYFKKYDDIIAGGQFNHSFFSGGLRDNVTMLDVKSYYDDVIGNNLSLAVGYSLSYLANDNDYLTRLGHVMNNGMVYIRATGDGTSNDDEGLLESGKGWSLKKETNVFHQFYGIDQYNNSASLIAAIGWNTMYHRNYFNITSDSGKAPQNKYSPNFISDYELKSGEYVKKNKFYGNTKNGTNCHPLADTQCTTVNWGQTWDEKTQAMWGTANGTLLSWYYDYEEVQSGSYTNSKITGVRKEFESYMWADRYGSVVDSDGGHYDLSTQVINGEDSNGNAKRTFTSNGFISVLDSVNSVAYGDGYWVAVGNCSNRNPADYCKSGKDNYSASGAGTYINVKFNDGNYKCRWKAIKVSDDRINFVSIEYCEGIWYAMGYVDANGNGMNDLDDPNEYGVIYYATNPTESSMDSNPNSMSDGGYNPNTYNGGWRQAITRCVPEAGQKKYSQTTTVMKRSGESFDSFVLEGTNSMASQG